MGQGKVELLLVPDQIKNVEALHTLPPELLGSRGPTKCASCKLAP
jgi:hypothetical protein